MVKIFTGGKDQFAGGNLYKADKEGFVSIPDEIATADGLVEVKEKKKKTFKIEGISENA